MSAANATSLFDPMSFNANMENSNPNPQPFTGGSNIAPMPVSSAKDNPFTDVLNHVSAFNDAMNPKPVQASPVNALATGPGGGDPFAGGDGSPKIGLPPPTVGGPAIPDPVPGQGQQGGTPPTTPGSPRGHASAPPSAFSDANPPPKPPNTEDPEVFAGWARQFAFKNPAFANITAADVSNQRALAVSGAFVQMGRPEYQDFLTWYAAGMPGGQFTPTVPPPTGGFGTPAGGGNTNGGGVATNNPHQPFDPNTGAPIPPPGTPPPVAPPTGTPPVGAPPTTTPPPATPPGTTPPATTPPAAVPPPDIQSLIDMFQKEAGANNGPNIESMLNPMFARQRQLASDQLRATAALTPGRLESGGFGQNEAQAISDLSGKQSATMADALQQQHLAQMQQNTQLMSLATTAGMQKYVTDINADLTRFQVNTNADLQKWLDNADNSLKKYGIDTNDVLARYQSELQLKGQMYSADRGVDAAALQAAAAHAAAAAQAAASTQNAQLQFGLGMQGLNVDREKNIGQFILGLLGVGNMDMNTINGILAGLLPGTTVVKP